MTRKELAKILSLQQPKMTAEDVDDFLEKMFNVISEILKSGEEVKLTNFGKFEPRHHDAAVRRNPRTGEKVDVGPRTSVNFRPSTRLKAFVNSPSQD